MTQDLAAKITQTVPDRRLSEINFSDHDISPVLRFGQGATIATKNKGLSGAGPWGLYRAVDQNLRGR